MNDHNPESVRLALVAMLRRCADFLAALPTNDVDAFLEGDLELRLSVVAKKVRTKKKNSQLNAEQLSDIAKRLRSMDSRASGEQLLHEVAPTRVALEALARHLDVSVRREDRQEDLGRRIIDSTIGFRLSSEAILGRPVARNTFDSIPTGVKK